MKTLPEEEGRIIAQSHFDVNQEIWKIFLLMDISQARVLCWSM
jgi:hypothetical protein